MDVSSDPVPATVHNGLKISYELIGSGEPVLFLPGTSTDSSLWMTSVATYFEGYRSILVDPRDTPKSDQSEGPYAPEDLSAEALSVLRDAEESSAHVVGYSLGGTVAQELAIRHPDVVRTLTLVCSWAKTDQWLRHTFEWLRDGVRQGKKEWADRALLWIVLSPELHDGPVYDAFLLLRSQWSQSDEALARHLECDIAHDAAGRLPSVTSPTLIIGSEDDLFIPARYSRELSELIHGANLEIIPAGSHGFPFEQPDVFFDLIKRHLDSNGGY
jgi:pimeloyl-ACP methyl ester carboxylesterase